MMSMQVRQQTNKKFKTGLIDLYSSSRTTIPPHHQVLIEVHSDADISRTTGTVEGTPAFMRKTCLLVSPAVVDLDDGKTMIQVTNPNEHVYTLEANTHLANFRIPTPHQAANITPMPVEHLKLITMREKLLEQNEERNRQTDTNAATSSFAVRSSNRDLSMYGMTARKGL